MLIAVDNVGHDHPGDGENEDTDEYLVGLKGCSSNRNHKTNTRRCRIKLTDHDSDKRASNRQAQPGQYERYRGRQHHGFKDLPFRSSKASSRSKQVSRSCFDAITRVDEQWEDGTKEYDANFRQNADTQPDNNQWQESDAGSSVHGIYERVANIGESFVPAYGDAKRNSDDNGQDITPGELDAAHV